MNCFKKVCSVLLAVVILLSVGSTNVFAIAESPQISEEFSSYLQDGKLVLNFAKPSSKDEWYAELVCQIYEDQQFMDEEPPHSLYLHDENGKIALSDDLSKITARLFKGSDEVEKHTVDVVWNYDKKVLQKAQEITAKLPVDEHGESNFYLSDLEFINYLVSNSSAGDRPEEMANYSGELKAIAGNTNFSIKMETRAGADLPFETIRLGITRMIYRDTVYAIWTSNIFAKAKHIIYVPETTPDDISSLLDAAQKRIDDYIGTGVIKLSDSGKTLAQYYQDEIAVYDAQIAALQKELDELKALLATEEAKEPSEQDLNLISELSFAILLKEQDIRSLEYPRDDIINEYNGGAYSNEFLKEAVGDYLFNLSVTGKEELYSFVIIKDDAKLSVPTYESVDVSTDVSASTDSSEVPLDTVIKVEKITHGEEHERICGVLEIKDGEIFDIKLHSGSLDDYITELKNGKFKVRLPIKNEYKDKELVVYYVDANGNKTKYDVTIKNNFAFFETEHFSIYTLTTVPEDIYTPPQTGDYSNASILLVMLFSSLIGLICTCCVGKKKANN